MTTATATTKKRTVKKSAARKTANPKKKAAAKKTATKKTPAAKKKATERKKKEGLRKPQVRVLQALKSGKSLDKKQLSAAANVDYAMLNSYVGANDLTKREANDIRYYPCLLSLKFVKEEVHDVDGRDTRQYSITSLGKKELAKVS